MRLRRILPAPKLVAGCLVIDAGRVLLLRRGNEPRLGTWTFPGGYVDLGETPEHAALRETLEEVGMRVTADATLGVYADPKIRSPRWSSISRGQARSSRASRPKRRRVRYFAADAFRGMSWLFAPPMKRCAIGSRSIGERAASTAQTVIRRI